MTDAIICGCGTLQVDTGNGDQTCTCGCGTTATAELSREEEIRRLRELKQSVDQRLDELEDA